MRLVLAILLASIPLWGDIPTTGGYAGAFTRIGINARSAALAGALVADINSGHQAYANPAGLVYVQLRDLGLSYMTLPLDRSQQELSLAMGLPPSAGIGIGYLRAGDDNIQGRDNLGERTEILTYSEHMVTLSFANRLSSTISLGLNAKLLFINLGDESSRGFGVDVGLLYHRQSGLNLALKLKDITGAYSWKAAGYLGERLYLDYLPITISSGVRLPWRHFTFFGQTDIVVPRTKESGDLVYESVIPIFRLAVEDLVADRYFIRGGLENTSVCLGFGLRYSILRSYDSRVDYSLSLGKGTEGLGHLFSWVFSI